MLQKSNKENVQKCTCLQVWQLFISQWQKHLSKKYPKKASPMSRCHCRAAGPGRHCCFCEHISSGLFCHVSSHQQSSADELELLCGRVQKAVLTCRSQDFTPAFSSIPAVWCTIINIAGSSLVQQSKLSTVTLCSFLVPMVGVFLVFIFFTSEVGNKELQLLKRGTRSYTAIQ